MNQRDLNSTAFGMAGLVKSGKQSRQVRLCLKAPPASKKRCFEGISSICNSKSVLMKKAKLEFRNSLEVKNLNAMKKMAVQRSYSSSMRKPSAVSGLTVASSSAPKFM